MNLRETVEAVQSASLVDADDAGVVVGMRLDDGWSVGIRLAPGTRRHWDVQQVLISAPGALEGGLDSQAVRELPLGVLLAEARRLATREMIRAAAPETDLPSLLKDRGGRLGGDDLALATVARAYARLVAEGDRAPARTLAERFGGAAGTWTNRVTAARRRGFLESADAGAAGGRLTAAAEAVLGAASGTASTEKT